MNQDRPIVDDFQLVHRVVRRKKSRVPCEINLNVVRQMRVVGVVCAENVDLNRTACSPGPGLRGSGFALLDENPCAGARTGMRVAFLYLGKPTGLLVELVQYDQPRRG